MATISLIHTKLARGVHRVVWETLVTGSLDGEAFDEGMGAPFMADKTIHVFGTWDTATLTIQGSNEATTTDWQTLSDVHGTSLALTADGIYTIAENPAGIRPLVSSVGASTDLDVIMLCHSNHVPK